MAPPLDAASAAPEVTFAVRFGENLRRLRERSGLTQRRLAESAALSPSGVGAVERGERVARADAAFRLAGALGVRIERLYVGIAWTSRPSGSGEVAFPSQEERHRETMRRAAALRASQSETVDAAELVREGREELERRSRPDRDEPPG